MRTNSQWTQQSWESSSSTANKASPQQWGFLTKLGISARWTEPSLEVGGTVSEKEGSWPSLRPHTSSPTLWSEDDRTIQSSCNKNSDKESSQREPWASQGWGHHSPRLSQAAPYVQQATCTLVCLLFSLLTPYQVCVPEIKGSQVTRTGTSVKWDEQHSTQLHRVPWGFAPVPPLSPPQKTQCYLLLSQVTLISSQD
jgi:hypothetical protein